MAKIVGYIAQSLDGFIADRDHKVGWLDAYNTINYGPFSYDAFIANIGTVVMGRKTFEFVANSFESWAYPDQRSIVITSPPLPDMFENVEAYNGSILELAKQLKSQSKNSWVVGGGQLQSAMIAQGLIDEIEIFVMPVLIGDGVPLWPGIKTQQTATLVDATALEAGVVHLKYTFGAQMKPTTD